MDNNPSYELAPLRGKLELDLSEYTNGIESAEEQATDLKETLEDSFSGDGLDIEFDGVINQLSEVDQEVLRIKHGLEDLSDDDMLSFGLENYYEAENKLKELVYDLEKIKDYAYINGELNIEGLPTVISEFEELRKQIEEMRTDSTGLGSGLDTELNSQLDEAISTLEAYRDELLKTAVAYDELEEPSETVSEGLEEIEESGERSERGFNSAREGMNRFRAEGEDFDIWTTMALVSPMLLAGKEAIKLGISYQSGLALARREFGLTQAQAIEFGNNTSNAFDMSRDEALKLTDQFGLSFKSMGANDKQAESLSLKMLSLAQNMNLASGGSITLEDATSALTNMLGGQAYGMEALGFATNSTELNQMALNSQWHKAYKKMTPLQQATIELEYYQKNLNKSLGSLNQNAQSSYGKFQRMTSQLKNTGEVIGTNLLPMVTKIGMYIDKLLLAFSKLSPRMQNIIEGAIMVGVAFKPVKAILGMVKNKVLDVIEVFGNLKKILFGTITEDEEVVAGILDFIDPITAVITAITLLGIAWDKNWFDIRGITKKGIDDIKKSLENFGHAVVRSFEDTKERVIKELNGFGESIERLKAKIERFFISAGEVIAKGLEDTKNAVVHFFIDIGRRITNFGHDVTRIIKSLMIDIANYIKGSPVLMAIVHLGEAISKLIEVIVKSIYDIVKSLGRFVLSWIETFGYDLISYVEKIGSGIYKGFEAVKNRVVEIFKAIAHDVESVWNALTSWFMTAISPIVNACESMGHEVEHVVSSAFHTVASYMRSIWNGVCSWFGGSVMRIVHSAENMGSGFTSSISNIMTRVGSVFRTGWDDVCSWFSGTVRKPIDEALNVLGDWGHVGMQWIEGLWHGMENAFTGMLNWLTGAIDGVIHDIEHATADITGFLDSHDGSHAIGLEYVPFDGYKAQLHRGEMVLTADQAEAYRNGQGAPGGGGNTYNFYSPKAIDPFQARQQIEQLNRNMANGFN